MNPYNRNTDSYRAVQINTASPAKLLVMVYAGAIGFLKKAKILMEKDHVDKAALYIMKAISALVELLGSLDHEQSPEISMALEKLYLYIVEGLKLTLKNKTVQEIDEAMEILGSLKDAWEEAFASEAWASLQKTGT